MVLQVRLVLQVTSVNKVQEKKSHATSAQSTILSMLHGTQCSLMVVTPQRAQSARMTNNVTSVVSVPTSQSRSSAQLASIVKMLARKHHVIQVTAAHQTLKPKSFVMMVNTSLIFSSRAA